MGTVFSKVEWPVYLVIGFLVIAIVFAICGCMYKKFNPFPFLVMSMFTFMSSFLFLPIAFPSYTADTIEYPVEKTSTMELLGTRQAEGQQTSSKTEAYNGVFTNYYKTEQTGGDVSRSIFIVKNPDGSYQQVRINSKQVKVYEDLKEGQSAYAVKHQGVYTNRNVYRPGETPLCLKDVDTDCQPNVVLNTSTEDDNRYDLHVPAGTVRGGEYSFSTQ